MFDRSTRSCLMRKYEHWNVVGMMRRVELFYMMLRVMSRQTDNSSSLSQNKCLFSNILVIAVVTSHKIIIDKEVITCDNYDDIKSH